MDTKLNWKILTFIVIVRCISYTYILGTPQPVKSSKSKHSTHTCLVRIDNGYLKRRRHNFRDIERGRLQQQQFFIFVLNFFITVISSFHSLMCLSHIYYLHFQTLHVSKIHADNEKKNIPCSINRTHTCQYPKFWSKRDIIQSSFPVNFNELDVPIRRKERNQR